MLIERAFVITNHHSITTVVTDTNMSSDLLACIVW